ncbi:MAG: hypothetical protein AB1921_06710 [Thermodesulfobacteriota bacterium]
MGIFDALRSKWKHSDPEVRLAAIRDLDDQSILAEIAESDPVFRVRLAAVGKLIGNDVLASVALKDSNTQVRLAAVARIKDQSKLCDIAANVAEERVRLAAVDAITDEGVLAHVANTNDNESIQVAAVRRITKDEALLEVAAKSTGHSSRLEAVRRMHSPALLARIAVKSASAQLRIAAAEKLGETVTNPDETTAKAMAFPFAALKDLAEPDTLTHAYTALGKISDKGVMSIIARSTAHPLIRQEAMQRVSARDLWLALARGEESTRLRAAAVSLISDQAELFRIAKGEGHHRVRIAAVHRLSDPAALFSLVRNDFDYRVRLAALCHITDKDLLAEAEAENTAPALRMAASAKAAGKSFLTIIDNLYITPFLGKVSAPERTKPDTDLKYPDINKIHAPAVLAALCAIEDPYHFAEINRTENPHTLVRLVKSEKSRFARLWAIEKIPSPILLWEVLQEKRKLSPEQRLTGNGIEDFTLWAILDKLGEKALLPYADFDWEYIKGLANEPLLCTIMATADFTNQAVIARERYRSIVTRGSKFHDSFGDTSIR